MPLLDIYQVLREKSLDQRNAHLAVHGKLIHRLLDVAYRTWDLGFTSFGGPNVHFQIFYQRFVVGANNKVPWIDEQTYQELFAVCQALPGPASTKMLFCLVFVHAGFIPAVFVFMLWALPGALGMFALAVGISRIDQNLPGPVYALLAGLNSATVGIIALAGVQLAQKAIKSRLLRVLVIFGACAGLCYNALWYFPVLILFGGVVMTSWEVWLQQRVGKWKAKRARRKVDEQGTMEENVSGVELEDVKIGQDVVARDVKGGAENSIVDSGVQRRHVASSSETGQSVGSTSDQVPATNTTSTDPTTSRQTPATPPDGPNTALHKVPIAVGITIILAFFTTFITIMILRGKLTTPPLAFSLFANMYLAGTVIFGGGPVVIPLLREYVVEPGWVSGRDFLLGLAIIQAFPGPNFNFAVFLGAITLGRGGQDVAQAFLGAVIAFLGIFIPGLTLNFAVQSLWRVLRTKAVVVSALKGINATAVGLVFTAVYRLWEIGYLSSGSSVGESLGRDPWWLVITVLTYAETAWFGIQPAVSIVIGGVLGLFWYAAVGRFG